MASLYGEGVDEVECIETHISCLFLTDQYVYKLKKPIEFGFLDYSTLKKRRAACEDEIRLNRRLAPDVYLDVIPVGRDQHGCWKIGELAEVEDWLVRMRRLPADRCLVARLEARAWTTEDASKIVAVLSAFYASLSPLSAPDYCDRYFQHIIDNREELLLARHGLPIDRVQSVLSAQLRFLFLNRDSIRSRVDQGRIVEGHGDLRAEHVYMTDPPVVIDGIEFSAELRTIDTADELCFFAMTCDLLGASELGNRVLREVCQSLGDRPNDRLLNFYRTYRACVRAKVAALRAQQTAAPGAADDPVGAMRYLDLAADYAKGLGPCFALLVRGLSGTGKSTLAKQVADRSGAIHLSTDHLRKELGAPHGSDAVADYSETARRAVYESLLEKAIAHIRSGMSVILDGTFQKAEILHRTVERLRRENLTVRVVTCVCSPEVALQRISKRRQSETLSDADEAVYAQQLISAERVPEEIAEIEIDTTQAESQQVDQIRRLLCTE